MNRAQAHGIASLRDLEMTHNYLKSQFPHLKEC